MKKNVVILLAVLMVTAVGCQKKEVARKTALPQVAAPQAAVPQAVPQTVNPQTAATQNPVSTPSGSDPHAAFKGREIPAGTGHKGKVVQTMDAAGYTYLEVEEKGQKLWLAVLKTEVKKGDTVEFPDSQPMENFQSKTLKRTFDKIIFADAIRVVK